MPLRVYALIAVNSGIALATLAALAPYSLLTNRMISSRDQHRCLIGGMALRRDMIVTLEKLTQVKATNRCPGEYKISLR